MPKEESAQRSIVLAVLAMVVLLDQTTKWWSWRHASGKIINPGADLLLGGTAGSWYADPVAGALLDILGFGFLNIAVFVLVRRRRPTVVFASAALMIGGWGSNLLDRLGMHFWTAPGSVRGAVDFIPVGRFYFNVADVFIVGATLLFVLSVGYLRLRVTHRPAPTGAGRPTMRRRLRRRAFASAFATAGAADQDGRGDAKVAVALVPRLVTNRKLATMSKRADMHIDEEIQPQPTGSVSRPPTSGPMANTPKRRHSGPEAMAQRRSRREGAGHGAHHREDR
jgi:lipoprotein signal peptidase